MRVCLRAGVVCKALNSNPSTSTKKKIIFKTVQKVFKNDISVPRNTAIKTSVLVLEMQLSGRALS
jgi:hypothetical protein